MTSRKVMPGDELCIFYGHKLWFGPVDAGHEACPRHEEERDDGWGGLSGLDDQHKDDVETEGSPLEFRCGEDLNLVLPEEILPFKRLKLTPDEEDEEHIDAVRRVDAWAVDLPKPQLAAVMLKWLKQSGFDTPSMTHLKRIRKVDNEMSVVLITTREHPKPPTFPDDLGLPPPYIVTVPKTGALTVTSLKLKSSLWPTIYAPRKKFEPEPWTAGKVQWACAAMRQVVREAQTALKIGERPIAAYVPVPHEKETRNATRMFEAVRAHDTRKSASHLLRHAIINLVRAVGELRASPRSASTLVSNSPPPQPTPAVDLPAPSIDQLSAALSQPDPPPSQTDARNGGHYLLTSLTLFTTHEPCIMCSMALLHSRVKEVFYLIPMTKTGGCGGVACVPRLEGVNHRYVVNVWKLDGDEKAKRWIEESGLIVDEACDA